MDWSQQPLGQKSDGQLSRDLGVHQSTVTKARQRLGIPPFQPRVINWDSVSFGNVADWVIQNKTIVEYAGFANHPTKGVAYRQRLHAKEAFYRSLGWEVQIIWPEELPLYDTGKVPWFKTQDACKGCGRQFGSRSGPRGGSVRRATVILCDGCWRRRA